METNERKNNLVHPSTVLRFYFRLHVNILKSLACLSLRTDALEENMAQVWRTGDHKNLQSQLDILKKQRGQKRRRDEAEMKYTVYNMITVAI